MGLYINNGKHPNVYQNREIKEQNQYIYRENYLYSLLKQQKEMNKNIHHQLHNFNTLVENQEKSNKSDFEKVNKKIGNVLQHQKKQDEYLLDGIKDVKELQQKFYALLAVEMDQLKNKQEDTESILNDIHNSQTQTDTMVRGNFEQLRIEQQNGVVLLGEQLNQLHEIQVTSNAANLENFERLKVQQESMEERMTGGLRQIQEQFVSSDSLMLGRIEQLQEHQTLTDSLINEHFDQMKVQQESVETSVLEKLEQIQVYQSFQDSVAMENYEKISSHQENTESILQQLKESQTATHEEFSQELNTLKFEQENLDTKVSGKLGQLQELFAVSDTIVVENFEKLNEQQQDLRCYY